MFSGDYRCEYEPMLLQARRRLSPAQLCRFRLISNGVESDGGRLINRGYARKYSATVPLSLLVAVPPRLAFIAE